MICKRCDLTLGKYLRICKTCNSILHHGDFIGILLENNKVIISMGNIFYTGLIIEDLISNVESICVYDDFRKYSNKEKYNILYKFSENMAFI